ncbi:MAG: TolC family protein [Acidobacteria bacterium]|nr:TolC family protein [Acidobacteriota bacterium]
MKKTAFLIVLLWVAGIGSARGTDFGALFRQSVDNNLQVQASRSGKAAAESLVKAARAVYLPQIDAEAARIGFDKPVASFIPAGTFSPQAMIFPLTEKTFSKGSITLDYLLFDFGGRRSVMKSAGAGDTAADLKLRSTIRQTGLNLLDAYEGAQEVQEQIHALDTARRASAEHLNQVRAFHREGLVAASDVFRLEALVANLDAKLAMAQAGLKTAGRALGRLTGTTVDPENLASLPEPTDVENAEEKALANREELRLLGVSETIHKLNATKIRSQFLPQFFVRVQYSDTTDDFVYNQSNTSFLLGVKFSLFDGFQRHYQRRSEILLAEQARFKQRDAKALVKLQVASETDRFAALADKVTALKRRLKSAEENYRVAQLQFNEHLISSVDLADAISLRADAQAGFHSAEDEWRASGLRLLLLSENMEEADSWLAN